MAILLVFLPICSVSWLFFFRTPSRTLPSGFPDLPDMTGVNSTLRELLQRIDANARTHPDSAEALGGLGMAYQANFFFGSAKSAYQLAARLEQNDYRWFYYQALLEEDTAQPEAFVRLLEKTIQLQNYLPAYQKLAEHFFKQDELQKSTGLYTHILELDPSFVPAVLGLARVAVRQRNWSLVIQRLEPLAQQYPRLRMVHQMLVDTYQALGRSDQELERRRILMQSNLVPMPPINDLLRDQLNDLCHLSTPLLRLAYAAESAGNFEKMLQLCRRAVRVDPTDADAHHFLSRALISAHGDDPVAISEAMVHRDEALRLRPDYPDPLMVLSQALIDRNNLKAAILQLEMLISRKPEHAEAHNALGIALTGEGKLGEATAHFLEALRLKAEYAEAHNNLGNVLLHQGNWKEAQEHYSRALEVKPDYAEAHYNLGNALTEQGGLEEAVRHFSAAVQLKPDYAEAYNGLGVALLKQGKIERALTHFSDALKIKPDFAQAQYNWGLTLARQGKLEEASVHFSEALRIKPDYSQAQESLLKVRAQQSRGLAKIIGSSKP